MIHIYTGDGKGKTTASLGLVLRAYGSGRCAFVVQFLKGRDSAEIEVLERLGIKVLRNSTDYGFFPLTTDEKKAAMLRENNENLNIVAKLVRTGECDFLILDEVISAYNLGALDRKLVDELIEIRRDNFELVLTGREPPGHFVEKADYVSEIKKIKHPYDSGVKAREGIEF
jgi:ATP:corrinoid adenosyltransferase